MTEAILAPSELEAMASLLQHLAEVFNYDGGGMDGVAATLVDLGCWIKLHRGESAVELVAFWLEKQSGRVQLE